MATLHTSPRVVKPVSGVVRLVSAPTPDAPGVVLINGATYSLALLNEGCGVRLMKADGVTYDLPADLSTCDCPDATYRVRPGGCKHMRAMSALRAAGKGV